jgi:hypothetical protein
MIHAIIPNIKIFLIFVYGTYLVHTSSINLNLVQVTDTLNQSRAFATVTVSSAGIPNIVAIATIAKQLRSDKGPSF